MSLCWRKMWFLLFGWRKPVDGSLGTLTYYLSLQFWKLDKKLKSNEGWRFEGDKNAGPRGERVRRAGADSDVTGARRFRSPAPERVTSPSRGRESRIADHAAAAAVSSTCTSQPVPVTMATDSWALAVDEQEAAAESVSWFQP